MLRCTIKNKTDIFVKKFNLRAQKVEFTINETPVDKDPVRWIKDAIEEILEETTKNLLPTDQIGISFCGKSFENLGPGWMSFRESSLVTTEDIWDLITKIFQSKSEGLNTDTFCLDVTSVRMPQGRGKTSGFFTFKEECIKRRGIITIQNTDNLCLPRALIVSIAMLENDPEKIKIRKNTKKMQTIRTMNLLTESGINIPLRGAGIEELQKFQEYLQEYKITVFKYGDKGRNVLFQGNSDSEQKINLLYHDNHFNVITSLTAAFCCGYFCNTCNIPYNTKNSHRCAKSCLNCQKSPPCIEEDNSNIYCKLCNRYFKNETCFINHQTAGSDNISICDTIKRCLKCFKVFKTISQHTCNEYFCKICQLRVLPEHRCFIKQDTRSPTLKELLFVFYDLETRQEKFVENNTQGVVKLHEPNVCVIAKRCDVCINIERLYFCQKCGFREQIYKENVIEKFIQNLIIISKKFKKVTVIAHNGKAFDHQFVLNYILLNTDIKPELIMQGTKIVLMTLKNIKFIDSLNYFPMPLAQLPKAFNLQIASKKGYFPHLFNTLENANYVGVLPAITYYSPDTMKKKERDELIKWYYETPKDQVFDMQCELISYCQNDVQILAEACIKFRKLLLEECNVCPFTESCTIASTCNLIYRRNFLKTQTIGIIPKNNYREGNGQSKIALQWLLYLEKEKNIKITHALTGMEIVINGVKVDGFCNETKQIFEFYGCYYHGHPDCFKYNRDSLLHKNSTETLNRRYEATISKSRLLKSTEFEVCEMWECMFRKKLETYENISFLNTHPLLNQMPLNPRDAFYGGRTGNTRTYYKCKENEKIKYIDVCSLYPWVCKYGKFPIEHPKLHIGNNTCKNLNLQKTEGLIKCKILPPTNLYHPVLPIKQNNKLMFTLCRTCSDLLHLDAECIHNEDEKALIGTWVIDEVNKAIEKQYKILEIFEIWEYKIEQYDKNTKIGGLFTSMMNKFIKMKQSASGFPVQCLTDEEKNKYIEDFLENEGIQLEFAEICKNPGRRSIAKLILNSFWGKFGQRENLPKTTILNEPYELFEMLTQSTISIKNIIAIHENTIIVNWNYIDENMESLSTVNVSIASYTTTQARLKLYTYLEKLDDRVLYYDTDSIIYISKQNEYEPSTGDFVGDMTDELENDYGFGSYITEFVSGGPKNYAFKVFSTNENIFKTVCKVKGICLNHKNMQLVNFETIKNMVIDETNQEPVKILSTNFRRTKDFNVLSVPESKIYLPASKKRKFSPNYNSVPFGYKNNNINNLNENF